MFQPEVLRFHVRDDAGCLCQFGMADHMFPRGILPIVVSPGTRSGHGQVRTMLFHCCHAQADAAGSGNVLASQAVLAVRRSWIDVSGEFEGRAQDDRPAAIGQISVTGA